MSVKFSKIAKLLSDIEKISSRLEMIDLLREFFSEADLIDIQIISYLIEGRIAPKFVPIEFNYSEKSLINGLKIWIEANEIDFDIDYILEKSGDIGDVVEELLSDKKIFMNDSRDKSLRGLSLEKVYSEFWQIASYDGKDSVQRKTDKIISLFKYSNPLESKYISRIISGKLRLGLNVKTLLDAVAALLGEGKESKYYVDKAYGFCGDAGYIVKIVREGIDEIGISNDEKLLSSLINILEEVKPVPGIPIFPELVNRVSTFDDAIERMLKESDRFITQPKFDGMRAQIHIGVDYKSDNFKERVWSSFYSNYVDGKDSNESLDMFSSIDSIKGNSKGVKIFSRNLEDITDMYPELVSSAIAFGVDSAIFDSEIVGFINGKFIPFQDTMTRRRKYGVDYQSEEIPVKAFLFDVLYLDGKDLTEDNLIGRIELLESLSSDKKGDFIISDSHRINDTEKLESVFNDSVEKGLEGVIVKLINSKYLPGKRSYDWIKLKKSIDKKLVDTVDLVLLGYYLGSGSRAKFGIGALLGGVYDAESDTFIPVTKIGTGITDDEWGMIMKRVSSSETDLRPKSIADGSYDVPDKWLFPDIVITVEADEISKSKVYTAGSDKLGYGLALRFPRLKVFDRDKDATDATSVEELVDMWEMRKGE
ncbi:MAG TPA: ATP-dependent DNA ligase [bacterium]|nr:ATP-dependent DNA ligase [bacterium]